MSDEMDACYDKLYNLSCDLYYGLISKAFIYPSDELYLWIMLNRMVEKSECIKNNVDAMRNFLDLKIEFGKLFFSCNWAFIYTGQKERAEPYLLGIYRIIGEMGVLLCVENATGL